MSYVPINCHFHDELEAATVRRLPSKIVYKTKAGDKDIVTGIIEDIYVKNKAEFLRLNSGLKIRLDWIVQFNDVIVPPTDKKPGLSC